MEYSIPEGYTEQEFREMMEQVAYSDMESAEIARLILDSL